MLKDASGKTSKQHHGRVNKGLMRRPPWPPVSVPTFTPSEPWNIPRWCHVAPFDVSINLSITSFLFASESLPFFLFGWHHTSVVSTPFTQPLWPLGLLYSPVWPLHTSQPAAICLFIRLRAWLIWPLSRTVSILLRWWALFIRPMRRA